MRTIVWFRGKDLRLTDHEPLAFALGRGEVIPLFVLDPFFFSEEAARELPHRLQFLLDSLSALEANIRAKGSLLVLARGPSVDVVPALAQLWKADMVVAHRWVEPFGRVRDERVARRLGGRLRLFEGETLAAPGSVLTGDGHAFSVYTPFARAFRREVTVSQPIVAPKTLPALPELEPIPEAFQAASGVPELDTFGLVRNEKVQIGGERAGLERLRRFCSDGLEHYDATRDRLDLDGTSRLSADLKFGTVSIRSCWQRVQSSVEKKPSAGGDKYLNELLWREFTHHTLWARPTLLQRPFRREFSRFPWKPGTGSEWQAWRDGNTGYPIVDAAARQLLQEGFVHNRARMITASFLTKHLLVHYKAGEAHYMKYLTDGDWAQNNAGWQWSAGCGCDAQPYFRVFNPVTQGEKFDPEGAYIKRYLPELQRLDSKFIHKPWLASPAVLARAGIVLGKTYPTPIVDLDVGRKRFLALAENTLKKKE